MRTNPNPLDYCTREEWNEYCRFRRLAMPERHRELGRQKRLRNPEKIKKQKRESYLRNREQHSRTAKAYVAKNRDKVRRYQCVYRKKHRLRHNALQRRRYWLNIDESRAWENERKKRRRLENIEVRIMGSLRQRVRGALKPKKYKVADRTRALVGCSIEDFKLYLESKFEPGMTWDNYGEVWEIDHIMPCAIFDLSKPEHQRRCFHFSNQQPLFAPQNRRKSAKVLTNQFNLL